MLPSAVGPAGATTQRTGPAPGGSGGEPGSDGRLQRSNSKLLEGSDGPLQISPVNDALHQPPALTAEI